MPGAQENEQITPDDYFDDRIKQIDDIITGETFSDVNNTLFRLLDSFLDDPTLLDPFLGRWCDRLSNDLRFALSSNSPSSLDPILAIFNHFSKIRGASIIRAKFPCDMKTAKLLLKVAPDLISSSNNWITRSMVLLWASLVILVPSQQISQVEISALCECAQSSLKKFGPEGSSAASFLSCAMRRPGSDVLTERVLGWSLECPNEFLDGVLLLLIRVLKSGAELSERRQLLLDILQNKTSDAITSAHTRRLLLRLRIYMTITFPGETDLFQSTVNILLSSMGENDSRIRWTAAKGIGRLSALLGSADISALVSSLINQIDLRPDAQHGTCLALGQIFSSGELTDARVQEDILKFVEASLRFELSKGTYSLGSNVRDAACYACWSMFRHQAWWRKSSATVIRLGQGLLAVSVLDREISCRRAGAAALQELAGRASSLVAHGHIILSLVNFFTVSNLNTSFSHVLPDLLKLQEYRYALLGHILTITCRSFDKSLRELAARSLASQDLDDSQLKLLLNYSKCENDPLLIHAGLMSLAYRLDAGFPVVLSGLDQRLSTFAALPNSRSPGYELMAESWLVYSGSLIRARGIASLNLKDIFALLKTALRSRFIGLHSGPCFALLEALASCSSAGDAELTAFYRTVVLPAADKDYDANAQRGFSAIIGAMPTWLVSDRLAPLTNLLCRLASTKEPINDIDKRVLLVRSIGLLLSRAELDIPAGILDQVLDCLLVQTDDYSIDSRGDVGSYIREEALKALSRMYPLCNAKYKERFLGKLLHQALDRLDRVRWLALDLLKKHNWPVQVPMEHLRQNIGEYGLLDDQRFQMDILAGWINSTGSPTPSISSPAWTDLCPHFDRLFPVLLSASSWWQPEHRLFRSLIATLQKWANYSRVKPVEYVSEASERLGKVLRNGKCPIQLQLDMIKLFKLLPCGGSNVLIEILKDTSPYPRVKQLCME